LVFADGAAEFAAGILGVLGDFARARGMAGRARALVAARFSWEIVTKRFERICLEGAGLA
jgi:glycosyltransferase involved in cell wall biosynthesis